MPVTIPATGTGTATPIVATDNVTADSSQVQLIELVGVSGGVLSRIAVTANALNVGGDTANAATDAGNPVKIGGRAQDTAPTAVTAGQRVNAWLSLNGAQNVILRANDGTLTPSDGNGLVMQGAAGPHDGVFSGAQLASFGGYASTAIPSAVSADGDVVRLWATRIGTLVTTVGDASGNLAAVSASADAVTNASNAVLSSSRNSAFNGTTWDRLRTIQALDAAPNVDTGILAIGNGPGWDRKRTASAMAVTLNAATTLVVDGAAAVMFAFKFNTVTVGTGTLVFEVAADDVAPTWVTAPTVMKMPDQTAVGGTFAPANNTQYIVGVAGWRQVRVRVASALTSGTIDVLTTATAVDAVVTLADRQRVNSYGAIFRLAETAATLSLSVTTVANTTKQLATLHHAATALKLAKIKKITLWLYATSAAFDGVLEVRRITAAPTTGAPAITPQAFDPAAPAAELTCLAIPGVQGTEAAVNSPVATIGVNMGITTAKTNNDAPIPFVLFDAQAYTDMQALNIRPLTLEGWAIDVRTVGITTVRFSIDAKFTEE